MFKIIAISIAVIISGLLLAPQVYLQYAIWDARNPYDDEKFINELLFPLIPNVPAIDVRQASDALLGIPIIDVRTKEEYDRVHIPGAILIPEQELYEKIPKMFPDKARTIYVYNNGGHDGVAARLLKAMGYDRAFNIEGGLEYWQKAQFPTETNYPIYF